MKTNFCIVALELLDYRDQKRDDFQIKVLQLVDMKEC